MASQKSRPILTGLLVFASGLIVLVSALLFRGAIVKFIVTFGLIITCIGFSLILHGALDRWFSHRASR